MRGKRLSSSRCGSTVYTELLSVAAIALLMLGTASAQPSVTIGPLRQSPSRATAGREVDFDIPFHGPKTANGISFNLMYGPTQSAALRPIFKTGSTTQVQCKTASGLDPKIATSAIVLPSGKIAFTVIGLSLTSGPIAFGHTGVVGTCKFMVAANASGTVPLPCDRSAGTTTASDVKGNDLSATCVDGTLTIGGRQRQKK